MAKDAKPTTTATETTSPKKNKRLPVIIIGTLALILALCGTAAFLLMSRHSTANEEGRHEESIIENVLSGKKKHAKETVPIYVALDTFTVNLVPESGEQFLQLILSVEVAEASTGDRIKTFTPKIRNNVMMLLSEKKASELLTKEGKETLAREIRDQMNEVLAPGATDESLPVHEVLFTSFIIQ